MASASQLAYQLKVTLTECKPPVWRRIQVPARIEFTKLHRIIQRAMGWDSWQWDYHLYQFKIGGVTIGDNLVDDGFGFDDDEPIEPGKTTKLKSFLDRDEGMTFDYEYDFGASWELKIKLEKVLDDVNLEHPICIGGRQPCPNEDRNPGTIPFDMDKVNEDLKTIKI